MLRMNFPGRKTARRNLANEMRETSTVLTNEEKIARLDRRLGEGVGAMRERKRLMK